MELLMRFGKHSSRYFSEVSANYRGELLDLITLISK